MKRIILLAFITIIAFSSCKKENNNTDPVPQETVLDYFPLTVGNYWIYEKSSCDSTWTGCTSLGIDTCRVTKDTIINSNLYFKIEGISITGQSETMFLRDSLNYLVTNVGDIFLSDTDFTTLLHESYIKNPTSGDTLVHWYIKMNELPIEITVPLGSFECLDKRMSIFTKTDNFGSEKNAHDLFAKNIGPVFRQGIFVNGGGGFKQELVSYHIEDLNTK